MYLLKKMNKKEILAISEVCEFYARVCSGDMDSLRYHYCYIEGRPEVLFELNAYFKWGRKCPQGVICWDIYQVIRHELWKLRKDEDALPSRASSVCLEDENKNITAGIDKNKCWLKLNYIQKQAIKDALDFYIAIGKGDFSVLFENNNLFEAFQVNRKYKRETLLVAIDNVMKLTKELKDSGCCELPDIYEKLRKKYD